MKKGGKRRGAGRKPKAEEVELIERLSPLDPIALNALEKGVRRGDLGFLKLFMEYRFGKPKQQVNIDARVEQPLFPDDAIQIFIPDNGRGRKAT
jgi:hypothetical protein